MSARALCVAMFIGVALAATPTHAQRQPATESGALLGTPTPRARARAVDARAATRTAHARERLREPEREQRLEVVRATARSPQYVEVRVAGPLAHAVTEAIESDLDLVPELRTDAGARFVVRGDARASGSRVTIRLSLLDRRVDGADRLSRDYRGPPAGVSPFVHDFVDEVIETLTGTRGAFSTRMVFARRLGPGRKAVFTMATDGGDVRRVSRADGIAMLPSFGPADDPGGEPAVWYSVATPTGVFITRTGRGERAVVGSPGVHMGVRVCGNRLLYASTRDGNTDLYDAALDGSDERRLTQSAAIDISPTCGPGGRIAFVSDRSGRPQLHLLEPSGAVLQLTRGDRAAQTPSWCPDEERPRLAFTRVGEGYRIMVLDLSTSQAVQISPEGTDAKDPAFSPDCRLIAWATDEGILVGSADGRQRRLVAPGHAETIRWWFGGSGIQRP